MRISYWSLTAAFLAALALPTAVAEELDWEKIHAASGFDAEPAAIIESRGFIYVTGRKKTVSGDYDYLTVKYYSTGREVWNQPFDGGGDDQATAMAIDPAGECLFVTGKSVAASTGYDYLTLRYDARTGQQRTSFRFGRDSSDVPVDIEVDGQGAVHVTGRSGQVDGSGDFDYLTLGYTAGQTSQTPAWWGEFDGPDGLDDQGVALGTYRDLAGTNYVVVTGRSQVAAGPHYDYVTLLYRSPSGTDVEPTDVTRFDNGEDDAPVALVVCYVEGSDGQGTVHVTGRSGNEAMLGDILTVKYVVNAVGGTLEEQWVSPLLGGSGEDEPTGMEVDGQGTVHVTGRGQPGTDEPFEAFLLMLDGTSGEMQDSVGCPSGFDVASLSEPVGIALNRSGDVYVAAKWRPDTLAGWRFLTLKYGTAGDTYSLVWCDTFAWLANDEPVGIALDISGNIYVTGRTQDSLAWSYLTIKYAVGDGWLEQGPMPLQPSGKEVRDGGWLACPLGDDRIFAAKGNRTVDFYAYFPWEDSWQTLTGMPYGTHPRWSAKPPSRGSAGITDQDNCIYVTQGNNTLGFWRYLIDQDSWEILADVPAGPGGKRVRGGGDLEFLRVADTPYVYFLKGNRCEFYRYLIPADSWEALNDAPTGVRGRWDRGSWLVGEGPAAETLFGHKASYNEFWLYDVAYDTWFPRTGMPLIGASGLRKKSKDGGSAAWYSDHIFALKGGNSQEFWKYKVSADTWVELDTMPRFGSSGKKRRVRQGGDIVSLNTGAFYALKGNRTAEFWRYFSRSSDPWPLPGAFDGTTGRKNPLPRSCAVRLAPNPLGAGIVNVSYVTTAAGPACIRVYDVAGRNVAQLELAALRTGVATLDLRALSAGVYLLRLESGDESATTKLVVQR